MFWGREDVYARRGKNGGYFPQCDIRWDVKSRQNEFIKIYSPKHMINNVSRNCCTSGTDIII
ncbi:MAG: hypothetical protein ACLTKE_14185 [Coprococcus sp.]